MHNPILKIRPKKKKKGYWSKKWLNQIKIGFWNPMSYSYERHNYCKTLNYDILGLTELHNAQVQNRFKGHTWIHSAATVTDENNKSTDPAVGVAILLSNRIADKVLDSGYVETRIVWVKIKGPVVCNIFSSLHTSHTKGGMPRQ